MVNSSKFSVDEDSLRYQARTKLADLAAEIAATRSLNKSSNKILEANKIRLWLKALDLKSYLTREQRERIWYALIQLSGVYDFPIAPVLGNTPRPSVLAGGIASGISWGSIVGNLADQGDLQAAISGKVNRSGDVMTGDLAFSASGINDTDNIQFNITPTTYTPAVGNMGWNDSEGTIDLLLRGGIVSLPLGQKQVARVVNGTGGNVLKSNYQVVKVTGAQGQRLQVNLAQGNNDANSADTLGLIAENINNNNAGFIITSGLVENINTTGSLQSETWVDGNVLYLSPTTAGAITNVKPQAPQHTVIVGFVVYAHPNNGKIFVKVDNGYEIDELHNVRINTGTLANGQVLKYNTSLSVWENGAASGTGTVTQVNATGGTGISVSGSPITTSGTLTITNTAPDQTVALNSGGTTTVTGTYPNFTISSADQFNGTVTSVSALTLGTSGTDLSSTVANGTTTPTITLNVPTASAVNRGVLSSADWTTFNSKQNALTNPVTGTGVSGQVSYWNGTTTQTGSSTFTFSPTAQLLVNNSVTAAGAIARGINFTPSLTAAANNDVLVGLDINPTFTNGAFTGVSNYGFRSQVSSGTGKWNIYADGTANNYLSGRLFIATTTVSDYALSVNGKAWIQSTTETLTLGNPASGILITAGTTSSTKTIQTFAGHPLIINNLGNNVLIGTTTDAGQRLQVTGDTLLKGSGNTDTTTALTVQNSDGVSILRVRNDSLIRFGNSSNAPVLFTQAEAGTNVNTSGTNLSLFSYTTTQLTTNGRYFFGGSNGSQTSSDQRFIVLLNSFAPTSGTATHTSFLINQTINQTGGANGITRGLYVNPTLTAAADWRSIEWSNNSGWGLYGVGSANNYIEGNIGVGSTSIATFTNYRSLDIKGKSSTAGGVILLGTSGGESVLRITGDSNPLIGTYTNTKFGIYTNSNERITIFANGNVAIGTTTDAGFKLDVNGTARIQGLITGTGSVASSNYNALTLVNTGGGGSESVGITLTPSTNIVTQIRSQREGAFANGNITFITTVFPSTSEKMRLTASGNLLINTTTDAGFLLDVNGTARIQGNLTTNLTAGSVPFIGTSGLLSQNNASLFWDNTNGRLGIGTNAPTVRTHIVYSDNIFLNGLYVQNTNTGTNAYTGIGLQDSAGSVLAGFQYVPNNFSNVLLRNTVLFASTAKSKLAFVANSGAIDNVAQDIYFATLGTKTNLYLYGSTGNLVLQNGGTFTDAGFRLDVNGTARIQNDLTISDTRNIILATTTGTKIGTATTQKLAFYGSTPVSQLTTAVSAATLVGGGGTALTDTDTFDGYTLKQIVAALRQLGLLA
jgi:hypothetical protein